MFGVKQINLSIECRFDLGELAKLFTVQIICIPTNESFANRFIREMS